MITVLEYLVIAAAIGAVVFFLAVFVFGRGEQMAPLDPRTSPAQLPENGVTADDVRAVKFSLAVRGYRMSDVDWTLERISDELAGLRQENAELRVAAGRVSDDSGSAVPGAAGTTQAGSDPAGLDPAGFEHAVPPMLSAPAEPELTDHERSSGDLETAPITLGPPTGGTTAVIEPPMEPLRRRPAPGSADPSPSAPGPGSVDPSPSRLGPGSVDPSPSQGKAI